MKIDFEKASFKDFENPVGMDAYERAAPRPLPLTTMILLNRLQ